MMSSTRSYLIQAFYEWIVDNGCTPYLVVELGPNVRVPEEHSKEGQIVLNISAMAAQHLHLGREVIEFQARFGAKIRQIYIPVGSVLAIYAKENGRGMVFAAEEEQLSPPKASSAATAEKTGLRAVSAPKLTPVLKSSKDPIGDGDKTGGGGKGGGKRSGGRPHLSLVK